jgi:hypothetical protein
MPDLSDIERILKENHKNWLATMVGTNFNRITLFLLKSIDTVQSKVYGTESGEEGIVPVGPVEVLITGDSFFPSDTISAGTLESADLFTTDDRVNVGDYLELQRSDQSVRRFKVVELESIGSSQRVFQKFKLSATGS